MPAGAIKERAGMAGPYTPSFSNRLAAKDGTCGLTSPGADVRLSAPFPAFAMPQHEHATARTS